MRTLPLVLIAGAALLAPTSAGAATLRCGQANGGFENRITAAGVTCGAAHRIVARWHDRAVGEAKGPFGVPYVGNFACRAFETDPEHVKVYCADGKKKVRFSAGP